MRKTMIRPLSLIITQLYGSSSLWASTSFEMQRNGIDSSLTARLHSNAAEHRQKAQQQIQALRAMVNSAGATSSS